MNNVFNESPFKPRFGLGAQAITLFVASGISQTLVAVLFILVARNSPVGVFGAIASSIAIGGAFVGIMEFGTNTLWVRDLARGDVNFTDLGGQLFLKLLAAISVGLALVALSWWFGFLEIGFPAFCVGIAFLINQNSLVSLRARGRADVVALCLILDRVSASGFFLLMVLLGAPSTSALWIALSLGALVSSALSYRLTPAPYRLLPTATTWTNPWKGAGFFGLTSLAISVQSLDLPLAGLAGGASVSGGYGAVNRWIQPLSILISSFTGAAVPFIAHARNAHLAWERLKRALWLPALTLLGCIGIWFAAPALVLLLLGPNYQSSSDVLRVLIVGVIPSFGSQIILVAMQSLGREKSVAIVLLLSTTVQLVMVYLLSLSFGALGVAIAFAVAQALTLLGLLLAIMKIRLASRDGATGDPHDSV